MEKIDPITSLAMSMCSKKGGYALLVGSGISRASQVPTGWEIVEDLVKKVAALGGEAVISDSAKWYEAKFGAQPDYSDLLDQLGASAADRSNIVRQYIEPNDKEREHGLKQPSTAHRAIAELVATGHVRVIVTTNFDRLLEDALSEFGVTPSVIYNKDSIAGTLPPAHNQCTIIKVHGDYLDSRTLNTGSELASYEPELAALLSQVFREYGLIVSGWSADWDDALRTILVSSPCPWFSTVWTSFSEPKENAKTVIDARHARTVSNIGADEFFERLLRATQMVESLPSSGSLSPALAVSTLKRYLDNPNIRIRTHELVIGEAKRIREQIEALPVEGFGDRFTEDSVRERLEWYEALSNTLVSMFAAGCFWKGMQTDELWTEALSWLDGFRDIKSQHYPDWVSLRKYPALLCLYAGGVAAISSSNYSTLEALLYRPEIAPKSYEVSRYPLILSTHLEILSPSLSKALQPGTIPGAVLPLRIRNWESMWVEVRSNFRSADEFDQAVLRFEYMFGLAHTDLALLRGDVSWCPRALLPYANHGTAAEFLIKKVDAEITQNGPNWSPLLAGMFGGSVDRLIAAKERFDPRASLWHQ